MVADAAAARVKMLKILEKCIMVEYRKLCLLEEEK